MTRRLLIGLVPLMFAATSIAAQPALPEGRPEATIDLASEDGVRLVKGQWRYSDTRIIEIDSRGPGADLQPAGAPMKTYDYTPHAGEFDFDDSKWETISATSLDRGRSTGRFCFNWYRINVTVPNKVGDFDPAGATVVFETALDDYAEVWVNGELTRAPGQIGGSVIGGWHASNRLIAGRNVKPGQKIQLAVFGVNGPLSNPPNNFIRMRYAKLDFYRAPAGPVAISPSEVNVEVKRLDPRMDEIVGPNPELIKLAEGFQMTEGPVWSREGGFLVFSDPNGNIQYKYMPDGKLEVFRSPSGYSGADIARYHQPGSNGLTRDPQGRLTINEHGNRRVTRLEKDGSLTVLADRYDGKRLNSPNDLVYRSDGTLYFTDPPFGLPQVFDDPQKELAFSGVYSLYKGKLQLISTDLKAPNGIAFSPDEKYLYVTNWEIQRKIMMRYDAKPDGTIANGKVFFDMTGAPGEHALDGMKVDRKGNLYVSGPGGVWVIAPDGTHLGTIIAPQHVFNLAWGGGDGKTLYMCARSALYRMPLKIEGIRP